MCPPDEADLAEERLESFLAESLTMNSDQLKPQYHSDFDGKHCVECGDKIPPARLAMGRVRCVHCQTIVEYKNRFH